ncbi:hypothetical protein JCM10908_000332 [Rhodotorula pacifica]|uniref:Ytp1p n=1 Tax=Rhodotorula pacifica TaxID=1495444 RepID=UPI00317400D8
MTRSLSGSLSVRPRLLVLLVAALAVGVHQVAAHDHHQMEDVGPYEQNFTNEEPLDSVIKWHIAIQIFCWGILFPVGMVLGITRSRFHVPLQTLGIVLTLAGNFLGHHHAGRGFHMTAHAYFASYLWWYLMLQTGMGVFLKLHVLEGTAVRKGVVTAHGIVGKSFPVVGWVQMIFGGIAALGFCFGDHLGQCLAHFIMGSAFIGYAMILLIMLRVGAGFLARKQLSQEYLDSWVIMLWGIVNTFTEHNFLAAHPTGWSHKDMQHVSLGVLWWAGGALGIFLGRKSTRNVVPAVIIGMTGYAMANHGQHLEFSTDVHKLFGWSLMSAGFARIVEVCFVLRDAPSDNTRPRAFQHLPPYLLVLSGLTFLSATEEQMQWIAGSGMDSTTYANILFSGAFAIYLVGNAMVELYQFQARNKTTAQAIGLGSSDEADVETAGAGSRYRSAVGSNSSPRVFGFAVPAALAGLFESISSTVRSLDTANSPNAARASVHGDREMAQYESLPLTGRDSADVSHGGGIEMPTASTRNERNSNGPGSGIGRGASERPSGSDETVFEIGDFEDDDGGDGYWQDKEEEHQERSGSREGAVANGSHRTARVTDA